MLIFELGETLEIYFGIIVKMIGEVNAVQQIVHNNCYYLFQESTLTFVLKEVAAGLMMSKKSTPVKLNKQGRLMSRLLQFNSTEENSSIQLP